MKKENSPKSQKLKQLKYYGINFDGFNKRNKHKSLKTYR